MTVYILRSVSPDMKPYDATSVSVYSTLEKAIDAFEREWTEWNKGLDAETDADMFVNVLAAVDEIRADRFVEILGTCHSIHEYEIDSNEVI